MLIEIKQIFITFEATLEISSERSTPEGPQPTTTTFLSFNLEGSLYSKL